MSAVRFDEIHDALFARGFTQTASIRPLSYEGSLTAGDERIPALIEFSDLELQRLPIIRLVQRPVWIPANCNHVDGRNIVCYASSRLAFIDRYRADAQVMYCLDKAAKVLNDIRRGNVLGDVDQEFAYYWKGRLVLVDADPQSAVQSLNVLTVTLGDSETPMIIDVAQDGKSKYSAFSPVEHELHSALLLPGKRTPAALTSQWPPQTLREFIAWLSSADPELLKSYRRSLGSLNGVKVGRVLFVFQTEPAWFGIGFSLPAASRIQFRAEKAFVNSIEHLSASIAIDRFSPIRIDAEYLVQRNLRDGDKSLLGKRVVLAGCGAIGGHLAHAIARVGAGFGGGMLVLVDPEIFMGGNVGRHRLGIESLFLPKAEVLRRDLLRALSGINARAVDGSVLDLPLNDFDVVVDATGEEQLSEALNARFIAGACAPIVFTWIVGNGVAVQSFTLSSREQGCLHCWKSHGDLSVFVPADVTQIETRVGRGCDDPYVPFSGAAPLAASSLALQALLDWSAGHPNPTLRSIELDHRVTRHIKPKTPARADSCPACGP
jgi:molybdopterin/thiamine biosynthesis adenylyltransferase